MHRLPNPLPSPSSFAESSLSSPSPKSSFPTSLPVRPGKPQSYLRVLLQTKKARIAVFTLLALVIVGGSVGAAVWIALNVSQRGSHHKNNSASAIFPTASTSAVLDSMGTLQAPRPTTLITQTRVFSSTMTVTGTIEVPWSKVQSTVFAVVTAAPVPQGEGCEGEKSGVTCAGKGAGGIVVKEGTE